MKKVLVLGTTLACMLFVGACTSKEKEVAPAATQQLYPSPTVKIGFSVHVLASSEAARAAGLDGATVTVKQNGNTYTSTTDESGIATFGGLTEGPVRWFVKKDGFSGLNGSTTLSYSGTPVVDGTNGNTTSGNSVTVNNEQTYSNATAVTLNRLGASVQGVLRGDLDGSGPGLVTTIASGTVILKLANTFEPNVYTTTISNGVYTFTNLPENTAFTLQTVDVFATEPASGTAPSYKFNLNFTDANGTTPSVGNTLYRTLHTLN